MQNRGTCCLNHKTSSHQATPTKYTNIKTRRRKKRKNTSKQQEGGKRREKNATILCGRELQELL